MKPFVTIGIPSYNRLDYLKEAVASAFGQTYPNIEILISQNPYQDERITQAIQNWCQELVKHNSKVHYQLHPKNIGSPANYNSIADVAHGEYLVMIGDDDRLLPNFVEKLVAAIEPDKNVAFSDPYYMNQNGKRLEKKSARRSQECGRDRLLPGEVNAKVAAWQKSSQLEASMIRTQDFRRLRFREELSSPDNLFFILSAQEGSRFVFVPDHLSEIRIHDRRSTAAGLQVEKLVPHLLSIPVENDIEPYKRRRLSQALYSAVTVYLLNGNLKKAKEYVENEYYPRNSFKGQIQSFCTMLPLDLGCQFYRILYKLKNSTRIRRRKEAIEFSNLA